MIAEGGIIAHLELEGLCSSITDLIQGLDVRALGVLQRAHILDDVIRDDLLWVDDGTEVHLGGDILEGDTVDLRDETRVGQLAGIEGQHDVLLIEAGQGTEGVGLLDALADQEILVGTVTVDDGRIRELAGEKLAAVTIEVDDLQLALHMGIVHILRDVVGDLTATDDHAAADRLVIDAELLHELVGLIRTRDVADDIPIHDGVITTRDDDLVATLDGADQDIDLQNTRDVIHADADDVAVLRHLDTDQVDLAAGEAVDLHDRREAKQTLDLLGGRHLRVDDHREVQLVTEVVDLILVLRVTDTRDGVTVTFLLCDQAAQHVDFIGVGCGDEDICILDTGLLLDRQHGAVSVDTHDIQ